MAPLSHFRRPYFTWWVTIIQIIVFIVAIVTYGIAPVGVTTTEKTGEVKKSYCLYVTGKNYNSYKYKSFSAFTCTKRFDGPDMY